MSVLKPLLCSALRHRSAGIALCVLAAAATPALAACPIERATYGEAIVDGTARIEFARGNDAATVTNRFRLLLDNNVVLDGIVQWSDTIERPNGKLTYKCPEGDATGPELAECTAWEGVIYTSDDAGKIALLPEQGVDAPRTLIFPDLAYALRASNAYGVNGFTQIPWDVFMQKGCQ